MTGGNHGKTIRVGSRKSELALIQTKHVIARLQKLYPHKKFEIHTMSTMGDRVLNISLPKIGEKSLFTRDLEDALRTGGVDFVVHSLKDLPTALPVGMAIGAVLEREDARDALVLRENYKQYTLQTLPKGSVIGTSSLRRTAQIKRLYPHLSVCDIRGNLNTRLAKLDAVESKFAGIILAQAGLVRMGWMQRISQVLEPTDLLYAVGQGALAVECRSNDNEILDMLQRLVCLPTTCRILAERSFLKTLGGGCSAPVAVCSKLDGDLNDANVNEDINISLTGAVWSLDGVTEICDKRACFLRKLKSCNTEEEEEEEPPCKRTRNDNESSESGINSNSSSPELSSGQSSPPVINDDADMEKLSSVYTLDTIIAKHVEYAKQCPVVGAAAADVKLSNNNGLNGGVSSTQQLQAAGDAVHCPIPIEVGQDFMGECPFVSNELKVSMAAAGQCPMTNKNGAVVAADEVDNAKPSTSKCPFSAMHNQQGAGDFAVPAITKGDASHAKCPFLQKTVQMFDYADEEKPEASKQLPVLIEDVDKLFCGLYQHACYNRELYVRSHQLGQQLAQELINNGALDVMKCAQAEIHSKS